MFGKVRFHKKFILKIITVLLICGIILNMLNTIFLKKQEHYYALNSDVTELPYFSEKWQGFYEKDKNTIDVLFLGTSVIHCGIDPDYLYENYGFTSYVLSADQLSGVSELFFLKEVLKTQTPKMVFIDVQAMSHPILAAEVSAHYGYDFMHTGINRIKGLAKISNSLVMFENLLFPFMLYHNRWEEINREDFSYVFMNKTNLLNGYIANMYQYFTTEPTAYDSSVYSLEELGYEETQECLDEIIDYCDEKNIETVLLRTPMQYTYSHSKFLDAVDKYAAEKDVEFWNGNDYFAEMGLDFSMDTKDAQHLNKWGAERFTKFLGKMISENYDLPDHRGDPKYAEWDDAYEYEQYLTHAFEIRHYAHAQEFADQRDYDSENLVFLYLYKNRSDIERLEGIPEGVKTACKAKTTPVSCILYHDGAAETVSLENGESWKSGSEAPTDIYIEALESGTKVWFGDEYITSDETDGMVDLVIYDLKLDKALDHVRINVNYESVITHLLNPYG